MTSARLTKREREELAGYVSVAGIVGRAVLFIVALAMVSVVARWVQRATPIEAPVWPAAPLVVGGFLYVRARRWTGGPALRDQIRLDLQGGTAQVHHIRCKDAIVFTENEDEGPVIFVETDSGETLVFTGQDFARQAGRGFPWREFEIREAPHSRRFLGFGKRGDPLKPSAVQPPLSYETVKKLRLDSVRTWQKLDMPFASVRQLAR